MSPESTSSQLYLVGLSSQEEQRVGRLVDSSSCRMTSCPTANQLRSHLGKPGPACVLSATLLPDSTGLRLLSSIVAHRPEWKVVFISDDVDTHTVVSAMRCGAFYFVDQSVRDIELAGCIQHALQASQKTFDAMQSREAILERVATLSARERQVLDLVVSGMANKQIAYQLDLCCKTVEGHRARVMHKMQADSLAELVRFYIEAHPGSIAA